MIAIYANNELAVTQLGWQIKYSLEDMMLTAWKWEQRLKTDAKLYSKQNAGLN